MRIGALWNKLANPKMFRDFCFFIGNNPFNRFYCSDELNPDQIYPRPEPQEQIDAGLGSSTL